MAPYSFILILLTAVAGTGFAGDSCVRVDGPKLFDFITGQRMIEYVDLAIIRLNVSMLYSGVQLKNATHFILQNANFRVGLSKDEFNAPFVTIPESSGSFDVFVPRAHFSIPEDGGFPRIYSRSLPPRGYDGDKYHAHLLAAVKGNSIPRKAKKYILHKLLNVQNHRVCPLRHSNDE